MERNKKSPQSALSVKAVSLHTVAEMFWAFVRSFLIFGFPECVMFCSVIQNSYWTRYHTYPLFQGFEAWLRGFSKWSKLLERETYEILKRSVFLGNSCIPLHMEEQTAVLNHLLDSILGESSGKREQFRPQLLLFFCSHINSVRPWKLLYISTVHKMHMWVLWHCNWRISTTRVIHPCDTELTTQPKNDCQAAEPFSGEPVINVITV